MIKVEHLFYEDCNKGSHNNWKCLLEELAYDEEALDYYSHEGDAIVPIDEWLEHVEGAWYFGARIYLHKKSGNFFWVYENLKGKPGNWNNGTEDASWIDLGNGTIQDWISSVKDKDAVIPALP